jgi:hypothetical protein
MKGADKNEKSEAKRATWWRFWRKPEYSGPAPESSWFLPRRVFRSTSGDILVAHGWAQPVWSPANTQGYGGYRIVGWVDLAHPSLALNRTDYTALYSEASYRSCKDLIRKVRQGALADQVACRAIVAYEEQ